LKLLVAFVQRNGGYYMEYNFLADLLNKFSQLTPWVQALLGLGSCAVLLGVAYFFKETIAVVISPFRKPAEPKPEKKE
jgi:hypothetical protein